ncbi:MAG: hypothetical protein V7L23_01610, partial [Nostoc sp.]|uniref:hypothetical protein n=1 Tax=Nostoc sp. TaxID=1180 RepID=UPI002FEF2E7F
MVKKLPMPCSIPQATGRLSLSTHLRVASLKSGARFIPFPLPPIKILNSSSTLVESMGDIIPRTSQLNLGVRLSPHPASDVLS